MADFYTEMQQFARDILSPTAQGGLGQGVIHLVTTRPGVPDPDAPWAPVEPVTTKQLIKGAVRGVSSKLVGVGVGETVILPSDRVAICEVPSVMYEPGDTLLVDGKPVHIIQFDKIPAAGITSAVRFIIRGGV